MVGALEHFINTSSSEPSFWHEVIDTMNEALIVVDRDRRIVYANRQAEALTGMPLREACGMECIKAISCPQCACVCRLFETGQVDGVEVTVFAPDTGERRTFLKNARLLHDRDGAVLGGVETFTDISKEVEERQNNQRRMDLLFREKRRSEALIDSLSGAVFSLDSGMRVRDFSRRMTDLTGFEAKEANGRQIFDLLGLVPNEPVPANFSDLPSRPYRIDLKDRNGSAVPVTLIFRPIRASDDELLVVARPIIPEGDAASGLVDADTRRHNFHGIISRSRAMAPVFELVESAALSDINVLVQGEGGTGKELVARAVHALSQRRAQPFYAVNCATLTGSLLLSELFGHEKGAFTGAVARQRGKLELADGGTLLLDEVGEIPIEHQALLLRVLEERTFERVGGTKRIPVNARIIAATNRSLRQSVDAGRFREDLYYRLKVVPIELPPLRHRPEDIELLARHFMRQAANDFGRAPKTISADALQALQRHAWPGNVRELKNVMEYLCFLGGPEVRTAHLPAEVLEAPALSAPAPAVVLTDIRQDIDERARIIEALQRSRYRRQDAARLLGVDRTTLWRRMRKLGIEI